MHRYVSGIIAAIALASVISCGPSNSHHAENKSEAERAEALRTSTFGPMVETMDRAAAVEQLNQDRKGRLDQALEESEGNRR
jgi:hypothetical protein